MLTVGEMQQIMIDEQLEKPPRVKGPEADKFRKDIQPDVALAKKNGWELVVPNEWETN